MSLFDTLSRAQLEAMRDAGDEIQECYRVLGKAGANVVGEVIKGAETFYEWDHYPDGDVYDDETHAQYYYHAHRADTGEHGHFHTFIRRDGVPSGIHAAANDSDTEWPTGEDVICHLIAISMDKRGFPTHLFTTNRWVTGENWYRAEDVIAMLDRFLIDHTFPSWATNRWISAMLILFQPQICQLVRERDEAVVRWHPKDNKTHTFEDRDLEITSIASISVNQQFKQVKKALKRA